MSARNPILDKVIPLYKEVIAKTGITFNIEALIVYSLLPKYELGLYPVKYINRISGLKWATINEATHLLAEEKLIKLNAFNVSFTHSLDALMIDEKFREVGIGRPDCLPNDMVRKSQLRMRKKKGSYFNLTDEQISKLGMPDARSTAKDQNKQFHLLYYVDRVIRFFRENNYNHPLVTNWKDNDPTSNKILSEEWKKLFDEGEARYRETIKPSKHIIPLSKI